ncbi:MAG TPA: hypothetical protein VKU02_26705, partial [Gemmataceae bacterium]|nr:hypothetical protein [Gemmataceae bacterium]
MIEELRFVESSKPSHRARRWLGPVLLPLLLGLAAVYGVTRFVQEQRSVAAEVSADPVTEQGPES